MVDDRDGHEVRSLEREAVEEAQLDLGEVGLVRLAGGSSVISRPRRSSSLEEETTG